MCVCIKNQSAILLVVLIDAPGMSSPVIHCLLIHIMLILLTVLMKNQMQHDQTVCTKSMHNPLGTRTIAALIIFDKVAFVFSFFCLSVCLSVSNITQKAMN